MTTTPQCLDVPRHLYGRQTGTKVNIQERNRLVLTFVEEGHKYADIAAAFGLLGIGGIVAKMRPKKHVRRKPKGRQVLPCPDRLQRLPGAWKKDPPNPARLACLRERFELVAQWREEGHSNQSIADSLEVGISVARGIHIGPMPELEPPKAPRDICGLSIGNKVERKLWVRDRMEEGYTLGLLASSLGVTKTAILWILGQV